jgi:hypothetical protein
MAKLTPQKIKQIVDRDMPGFIVVPPTVSAPDSPRPIASAEAVSPEIDALRRHYSGQARDGAPPSRDALTDSSNAAAEREREMEAEENERNEGEGETDTSETEDAIVLVQPKAHLTDPLGGPGPKAVVISKGKISAKQG